MSTTLTPEPADVGREVAEPAWEIARLFPNQGHWDKEDYLQLSELTNHLVEFADGRVEVLPTPTDLHQRVLANLYRALYAFVEARRLGVVRFSALPVRLWEGRFREPDMLFMLADRVERISHECWDGADLVMEVVSDSNRALDTEAKRREYAQAQIPEYWIVDPTEPRITVLTLPEGTNEYAVHGVFGPGAHATSVLLPGFTVDVLAALKDDE